MECRLGCGACCIEPSISSSIPGMPNGKPAGVRCVQLNSDNLCMLFGDPSRPKTCLNFKAVEWSCGTKNEDAFKILKWMEDESK